MFFFFTEFILFKCVDCNQNNTYNSHGKFGIRLQVNDATYVSQTTSKNKTSTETLTETNI